MTLRHVELEMALVGPDTSFVNAVRENAGILGFSGRCLRIFGVAFDAHLVQSSTAWPMSFVNWLNHISDSGRIVLSDRLYRQ